MKHRFKTIGGLAAVSTLILTAASCTKQELSEEAQQYLPGVERHVSISTAMPARNSADKAFVDANRYVEWEVGDLLNINGTSLETQTVWGENRDTASFDGDVYALQTSSTEVYWSVYPASLMGNYSDHNAIPSEISSNGSTIDIIFPTSYTYSNAQLDKPLKELNVMVNRSEIASGGELKYIAMKNLGAIIKINMQAASATTSSANNTISKVILSSCDGYIAGKYRFNSSYALSTISGNTYTNTVTINFSTPIDITSQKSVYALLPPTLSSNCLNITLVNTDGDFYHKVSSSATLQRNKLYTADMLSADFTGEASTNSLNNTDYYFTVDANRTVLFSPGNLQYNASNTEGGSHFRFAPNQWNYVGTQCKYGNVYDASGAKSKNESISSSYNGWIDLFGWGTSGYKSKYPYMTSTTNTQYGNGANNLTGSNANYDWGVYNAIYNPKTKSTDAKNTWRLLTSPELEYLLATRATNKTVNGTRNARYTMAIIRTDANSVHGLILFPDNYNGGTPTGVTWGKINGKSSWGTRCTAAGWTSLEKAGCVFIPAAGFRTGTTVYSVGANQSADQPYQVYVWLSTHVDENYAHHLLVNTNDVKDAVGPQRSNGYAVRLVKTR